MSRPAALLALLCALVGLGASIAAANVHYHLLFDPHYTSFCDVNATFSCTQVYQSQYSAIAGVPVAIFGAIWFAFAGLLSIGGVVARPTVRESVPGYLFAASTIALAIILYLAYVSFFLVKAVCILCLLTYAAAITAFITQTLIGGGQLLYMPMYLYQQASTLNNWPFAAAISIIFLVAVLFAVSIFNTLGRLSKGHAQA